MRFRTAVLLGLCVFQSVSLGFTGVALAADAPPAPEITELFPDPASPQSDADDEFVELYNPHSEPLKLSDFRLRVGTKSYSLPDMMIEPEDYVPLASADYPWSLTNTGGTIALLDAAGHELQTVTWPKAVSGSSWMKEDNNWSWTLEPTPGEPNVIMSAPPVMPPPSESAVESNYPLVEITELLPDPASPQTDSDDEYIELFNPNATIVSLEGYVIKTGKSLSSHYTLPDISLDPGEYLALKSSETHLGLTNTGSSAAIFDPAGRQLGSAVSYLAAKPGLAWAWSETGWTWTSSATPGAANIIETPVVVAKASVTKSSATKPSTAKTSATQPKSTASKAKAGSAKATPKPASTAQAVLANTTSPSAPWLLFALAALTIGYIIYEFRHDLLSYYHRLRGYTRRSRPVSLAAEGRDGYRAGE